MLEEIYTHTDEQSKREIENIIHTYIYDESKGLTNNFFYQTNDNSKTYEENMEEIPEQGYKFHISATNLQDYERLLKIIVPDLVQNGVLFKVVDGNSFELQMNSDQIGKAITVYPSSGFDFNKLSPETRSVLSENSIEVNGDENIYGRIFARYGRFTKGSHNITTPNGEIVPDPKYLPMRQSRPEFEYSSSKEDILTFFSRSEQKFEKTWDYKTYYQEKFTMTECDGKNHSYVAFNVPNIETGKMLIANNERFPNKLSFVKNIQGTPTVFVHKSELGNFFAEAQERNVSMQRPSWDIKENSFIIPSGAYEMLSQKLNNTFGCRFSQIDSNTLSSSYNFDSSRLLKTYTKAGNFTVFHCDTVFTKELLNECDALGIPYEEYQENKAKKIQKSLDKRFGISDKPKKPFLETVRQVFHTRPNPYVLNPEKTQEIKEQSPLSKIDAEAYFYNKMYFYGAPQTPQEQQLVSAFNSIDESTAQQYAYEFALVDRQRNERGLPQLSSDECGVILFNAVHYGLSVGACGLERNFAETQGVIEDALTNPIGQSATPTKYEYNLSRWNTIMEHSDKTIPNDMPLKDEQTQNRDSNTEER